MIWNRIEEAYQNAVYTRVEETKAVFYFSKDNFEGLSQSPFMVRSSKGHRLQGYFYSYPDPQPDRIVIFEHGMGSGHRGYMKEIELLAKAGYLVYAYDHTGCMESGGETTGGFSALNIAAIHPEVKKVVAISGFISPEKILKQTLGIFYQRIYNKEKKKNPRYMKFDALNSLHRSKAQTLIIHSDDDPVVSCKKHFDVMHKAFVGYENITFWKVSGKGHNPNYTADAVKYKDAFFKRYRKALKTGALETDRDKERFAEQFDWDRMTEQDPAVWERILEMLAE